MNRVPGQRAPRPVEEGWKLVCFTQTNSKNGTVAHNGPHHTWLLKIRVCCVSFTIFSTGVAAATASSGRSHTLACIPNLPCLVDSLVEGAIRCTLLLVHNAGLEIQLTANSTHTPHTHAHNTLLTPATLWYTVQQITNQYKTYHHASSSH